MAKKNFYAVKAGLVPGIYKTWHECKMQTDGFSGAVYKGFSTLAEAKSYMETSENKIDSEQLDAVATTSEAIAYVDGSYEDSLKVFSYGLVLFRDGIEEHFAEKYDTSDLISMRNVAGEIIGAQKAMQYCIDNDMASLDLYYDYEGIEKWCTGEWKTNKEGTKNYKKFYDSIKADLEVAFFKVAAHTGDTYNELADKLAKSAITGNTITMVLKEEHIDMLTKRSSFLERDSIDELILKLGKKEWGDSFSAKPLVKKGAQERCEFMVDSDQASVDFYFKKDGTTTIRNVGNNNDLANRLIELIEETAFQNKHQNASCTFSNVSDKTYSKLIEYMKSLEKSKLVEDREILNPSHTHVKFASTFGDSLVINHYSKGTIVLQGNPAYLFTEALSLMSTSDDISLEDIVQRKNEVYNANITIDETRAILAQRLPNACCKLDETIIKLLSPSIALSVANIEVEDYSCYVFPALKALESLLLYLLGKKGIMKDTKSSFAKIFNKNIATGRFELCKQHVATVNDTVYQIALQDIYNYFHGIRHVTFHANQVLTMTTIVEDKTEADAILNQVLTIFDDIGLNVL